MRPANRAVLFSASNRIHSEEDPLPGRGAEGRPSTSSESARRRLRGAAPDSGSSPPSPAPSGAGARGSPEYRSVHSSPARSHSLPPGVCKQQLPLKGGRRQWVRVSLGPPLPLGKRGRRGSPCPVTPASSVSWPLPRPAWAWSAGPRAVPSGHAPHRPAGGGSAAGWARSRHLPELSLHLRLLRAPRTRLPPWPVPLSHLLPEHGPEPEERCPPLQPPPPPSCELRARAPPQPRTQRPREGGGPLAPAALPPGRVVSVLCWDPAARWARGAPCSGESSGESSEDRQLPPSIPGRWHPAPPPFPPTVGERPGCPGRGRALGSAGGRGRPSLRFGASGDGRPRAWPQVAGQLLVLSRVRWPRRLSVRGR